MVKLWLKSSQEWWGTPVIPPSVRRLSWRNSRERQPGYTLCSWLTWTTVRDLTSKTTTKWYAGSLTRVPWQEKGPSAFCLESLTPNTCLWLHRKSFSCSVISDSGSRVQSARSCSLSFSLNSLSLASLLLCKIKHDFYMDFSAMDFPWDSQIHIWKSKLIFNKPHIAY